MKKILFVFIAGVMLGSGLFAEMAWTVQTPELIASIPTGNTQGQIGFNPEREGGIYESPRIFFFTSDDLLAVIDSTNRRVGLYDPETVKFLREIHVTSSTGFFNVIMSVYGDSKNYWFVGDKAYLTDKSLGTPKEFQFKQAPSEFFMNGILWKKLNGAEEKWTGIGLDGLTIESDKLGEMMSNLNQGVRENREYSPLINQTIERLIESGKYLIANGRLFTTDFEQEKSFFSMFVGTDWRKSKDSDYLSLPFQFAAGWTNASQYLSDGSSYWTFSSPDDVVYDVKFSPFGDVEGISSFAKSNPVDIFRAKNPGLSTTVIPYSGSMVRQVRKNGDLYYMLPTKDYILFFRTKFVSGTTADSGIDRTINLIQAARDGIPKNANIQNETDGLSRMSIANLRLLRNTLFALQGYVFQSADLKDYFSKFDWYKPNPKVKSDPSILPEDQKRLFDLVVAEEARRK